jgi:hypothetical protein
MGKTMIERERELMDRNPNVVAVSPDMNLIDEQDEIVSQGTLRNDIVYGQYEYIDSLIQGYNYICTPAVMFRCSYIRDNNILPDSKYGPASDVMFWSQVNMSEKDCIYIIGESLYNYRIHASQMSSISGYRMNIELDTHYRPFLQSIGKDFVRKYDRHFIDSMQKKIIINYCHSRYAFRQARKDFWEIRKACRERYCTKDFFIFFTFIAFPFMFRILYIARRVWRGKTTSPDGQHVSA